MLGTTTPNGEWLSSCRAIRRHLPSVANQPETRRERNAEMTPSLLLTLLALQATGSGAALESRVEIVRTEYGIPHIMAEDLEAMGFGLAYVQSEDFGASVAIGLLQSRGTLARYEGRAEIEADFVARVLHARAVETFHRLDTDTRAVYEGFAEGLNHYIRLHPTEFPQWMEPNFTGVDAHARDVQTWSRGDAAQFVRDTQRGADAPPEPGTAEDIAFDLDGSNAWAFDGTRTTSGKAILLRNPHLTWGRNATLLTRLLGSTYYEAHVRVPGVLEFYGDFRIGGAFGIIGGFNRYLGWATTNNYPRYSQVYALAAHPALENHAVLDGEPLALTERTTVVDYRTADGDAATESRSTWWTEYGPVIHRTPERIYILKDPRDGEFRRGEQFLMMMMSKSLDEWLDVMRMRAHPSSNFTYADADGNIVHYYNARLPLLPHEATGDTAAFAASSADMWSELVPWADLPLYINPPGGYVQQANDTPDFTNLNVPLDRDTVAANLPEPRLRLRSQLSLDLVHNDRVFSLEDVIEQKHSPRMLMAERVMRDLLAAGRESAVPGLDDALGKPQVAGEQRLAVVHDENPLHVQVDAVPGAFLLEHVERRPGGQVQQRLELDLPLGGVVDRLERVGVVVGDVLVKFVVLFLFDLTFRAHPDRLHRV